MRSLVSVGGGGGINNGDDRNTPSRCSNTRSTVSRVSNCSSSASSSRHDLTSKPPPPSSHTIVSSSSSSSSTTATRPQQNKLNHQKPLLQKHQPDSSRPTRNIRPSISPTIRKNPAASAHQRQSISRAPAPPSSSSSSPVTLAVAVAAHRRPAAAQPRTTNNPTSTNNSTADLPLPHPAPTVTTTTTTTTTTGPPTTTAPRRITAAATASTAVKTTTASTTTTTTSSSNSNPNITTTSSPSPPANPTSTPTPTPPAPRPPSASSRRQQPALSSSLRTPLHSRDQNVLNPSRPTNAARAKPSPTPSPASSAFASSSSTPTMPPYEKGGSTTTRQPAMPSLSAKTMGRPPLTPKVAAKPSPPVVTPMGRRRNDNTNSNNNHPLPHTTAGGARDDLTSPAPFLAATSVTPRSGGRQSRGNSANTTPNGTPNPDRNEWDRQPILEPPRRQVVTFSPPSNVGSRNDAPESKFFYASEAKPSQPAPQPAPKLAPQTRSVAPAQRGSTFMYANGSAVEENRPTSPGIGLTPVLAPSLAPSLSPSLAPAPEPPSSKFFYANGAPNLQPGFRPSSAASGTGSVVSGSSRLHRTSAGSAGGFQMAPRPLSPNKPAQPPTSAPLLKSSSMPPHTIGRAQMTSPPPLAPSSHKRRTSTETVSQVASYVGSEAPATDAMIMSKFMASQTSTPSEMPSPTASSFFPQQPITIASILQAAEDLEEEEEDDDDDDDDDSADESKDLDVPNSPSRSSHGDPLNDMVLNARRERKVQDLEIRNGSLEAINRSLERQLRKQTAELRRYKRLSRSGRLSVPTSAPSSRVTSDTQPGGLDIDGLDLSDLSEEEAGDGPEDMDDSMFESSELSETDSASAASPRQDTDRDVRRRTRDEKRLQLDLSKHRELLVDSQKINQSIKRCLNWTEELIKEGKKALEYNVRPSDVQLPPRVLRPAYLEENEEGERGEKNEFSVSLPSSPSESTRSLSPHWSKEPQDRDSGIELPADG